MAEWSPLDNPSEVSGQSPGYYLRTFNKQDEKRRKQVENRRRQEAARKQAEAKRQAEEQAEERQRKANTINPLQKIGEVLAPVGEAIQAPFDFIADKVDDVEEAILGPEEVKRRKALQNEIKRGERQIFQRGTLTPKQRQENVKLAKKLKADMEAPLEVLRAPVKAAVAGVEGVLDIVTQAGLDMTVNAGAIYGKDPYIRSAWDFGVTPKTQLGKTAAGLLSFAVVTRQANKALGSLGRVGTSAVPEGLKGAKLWAARGKRILTEGLIPGAVADFILTDPEDGNLSSLIRDLMPEEIQDSVWFALAADEDDNPWLNRIKGVLEGGPLNAVGNAVAALIRANRVARAAKKAGASDEEAVAKGVDAFAKETDDLAAKDAADEVAEGQRWSEADEAQLNDLLAREEQLNEIARIDPEADPDTAARLDAELEDLRAEKVDLEARFYENADPDVPREFQETQAAMREPGNPNDVVVSQVIAEQADNGLGRISKAARARHVMTDAQLRIMNLDGGQIAVIDRFKRRIDFADITRRTGWTVAALKQQAARILDEVSDAFMNFDDVLDDRDMIKALANAGGAIITPRGTFLADPAGAIATKALIDDLSKTIYDIAYSAEQLDYSQIGGFNNYDRLIDRFVGLMGIYKESSSYFGSALNSWKVRLRSLLSGQEQVMQEMEEADTLTFGRVKKWAKEIKSAVRRGDADAVDKMRELTRAMVLAGGDPANSMKFTTALFRVWSDATRNIYYNNILSGTKTQIRNMSGVIRVFLDPAAIALRGAGTGDEATLRAGLAGLNAIHGSLSEAWKVAKITFAGQIPTTSSAESVMEMAETEAGIQMMEQMARGWKEQQAVGAVKWWLRYSQALNIPGRLLMSTDDFMRTVIARQRIAEKATYEALTDTAYSGDKAELIRTYMEKYNQYIDPQTGEIRDKGLALYSDIGTFQDNPGAAVNGLTQFLDNIPFARYVVPFVRTPANIMKYQLEFMPLTNKFSKRYMEAVANNDRLTIAELEGRQAIGAMVACTGFLLGLTGNFTGNLPIDPAERQRWKSLGIPPRSIKVGNNWVSYNTIEPLNNILAASIDIAAVAKDWEALNPIFGGESGTMETLQRLLGQLVLALAASFTEKSYFANFEALSQFIKVEGMSLESVQKMVASYSYNVAVPWSGAVRGFANSFDPYQREFDNEWQRVFQGNIPGLRNLAAVKHDILAGRPFRNPYGNIWNANVPFEINPDDDDPVKNMLMQARYNWNDEYKALKTIKLDAEQRSFMQKQMYDAGLRSGLLRLMKKDWFIKDMKAWKGRAFDPQGDPAMRPRFYNAIADQFSTARKIAMARLRDTDQKFNEAMIQRNVTAAQYKLGDYDNTVAAPQVTQPSDTMGYTLNKLLNY